MLIGAQLSFFYQHPTAYLSRLLWEQGTHAFRERLALSVLLVLGRRYVNGQGPWSMNELAIELRLPVSLVEEQVQHLVEASLLGLMARPEGVSLTKPIELISVMEVLNAIHKGKVADATMLLDADDAIREVLNRRDEAVKTALEGHTLRSLIESSTVRSTREDGLGKRPAPFVHRE